MSVQQHFASFTTKPTTSASASDAFNHPEPQPPGQGGSSSSNILQRWSQKIQPWTQSKVLTTFKAGSSSWSKHKDGAAGKKCEFKSGSVSWRKQMGARVWGLAYL